MPPKKAAKPAPREPKRKKKAVPPPRPRPDPRRVRTLLEGTRDPSAENPRRPPGGQPPLPTSSTVVRAEMPSERPRAPNPSQVVALTEI